MLSPSLRLSSPISNQPPSPKFTKDLISSSNKKFSINPSHLSHIYVCPLSNVSQSSCDFTTPFSTSIHNHQKNATNYWLSAASKTTGVHNHHQQKNSQVVHKGNYYHKFSTSSQFKTSNSRSKIPKYIYPNNKQSSCNNSPITDLLDLKPSILGPRPSILGRWSPNMEPCYFNTRLSILGPRKSILGPHPSTMRHVLPPNPILNSPSQVVGNNLSKLVSHSSYGLLKYVEKITPFCKRRRNHVAVDPLQLKSFDNTRVRSMWLGVHTPVESVVIKSSEKLKAPLKAINSTLAISTISEELRVPISSPQICKNPGDKKMIHDPDISTDQLHKMENLVANSQKTGRKSGGRSMKMAKGARYTTTFTTTASSDDGEGFIGSPCEILYWLLGVSKS